MNHTSYRYDDLLLQSKLPQIKVDEVSSDDASSSCSGKHEDHYFHVPAHVDVVNPNVNNIKLVKRKEVPPKKILPQPPQNTRPITSAKPKPPQATRPTASANPKSKPKPKPTLAEQLGEEIAQHLVAPEQETTTLNLVDLVKLTSSQGNSSVDNTKPLNQLLFGSFQSSSQSSIPSIAAQLMITQLLAASGLVSTLPGPQNLSLQYQQPKTAYEKKGKRANINTFTLSDFAALTSLESLVGRFGRVSHMGILDPSYSFFLNEARDAALYYKIQDNIAVVGGDPLCRPDQFPELLKEFQRFRKQHSLGIAFLGATDSFVHYAKSQKNWVTMRFGSERVINPLTNVVLQESGSKRMIQQNKMLIDKQRGGIGIRAYSPTQSNLGGRDLTLETQLASVYHTWREQRNQSGQQQTYMTVFDPFAIPSLMVYIYTIDLRAPEKGPNGFAALRKLGANQGYHLDPCCVTPDSPKGITDLLVFSAMSLLKKSGIAYMSLGFEPSTELSEVTGMSKPLVKITQSVYRHVFQGLAITGKKAFHDKYRPDENLESGLHLVFPNGRPGKSEMLACMHIANISLKQVCSHEMKKKLNIGDSRKEGDSVKLKPDVESNESNDGTNGNTSTTDEKVEVVTPKEPEKPLKSKKQRKSK